MAALDEKNQSADTETEGELAFRAQIVDGFTFRGLVEILYSLNTEGTFVFTKEGCSYLSSDDKRHIIIKIIIEKRQMIRYEFSPEAEAESVVVTLSMDDFKGALKSVAKRESLVLWQYRGDSNFYISRGGCSDVQYIATLDSEKVQTYVEPVYKAGINDPNYVISAEDLNRKFSSLGTAGGVVTIVDDGEQLQIRVESSRGSGSRISVNKTPGHSSTLKRPQAFQLTKGVIKLMSKIQVFHRGVVPFYTEEGLPLKFSSGVGTYGSLTAYISNVTDKWELRKQEEAQLQPVSEEPDDDEKEKAKRVRRPAKGRR